MNRPGRWLPVAFIFCAATLASFVFAYQAYQRSTIASPDYSWRYVLVWQLAWWYLWISFYPVVIKLLRRYPPEQSRWYKLLLLHLLAGTILTLIHTLLHATIVYLLAGRFEKTPHSFVSIFMDDAYGVNFELGFFGYAVLVIIGYAVNYFQRYKERELNSSRLQAELAQTQFQTLKMQMHPDFLFSTLRSIAVMMKQNVEAADSLVARLGDFLRMTLDEQSQQVTLERELAFVQSYVEIEQMCLNQRIILDVDVQPDTLAARVPSLILQPLVENAVQDRAGKLRRIAIRANRLNGSLLLGITEESAGGEPKEEDVRLEVRTRLRLKQLYGTQYKLQVTYRAGGIRLLTLEIPFQKETQDSQEEA
jgi:two-component system, LytTR family, sensor kinase